MVQDHLHVYQPNQLVLQFAEHPGVKLWKIHERQLVAPEMLFFLAQRQGGH
jgi:hypothetical protein